MSLVTSNKLEVTPEFYLPHHGILREQNRTTKLSVVFNGSSKTSSGNSLNDILFAGANLQIDIFEILLWIRLHRYCFSTDITKMFRQIQVHPEDWKFQKIFWRGPEYQLLSYQLTTVTYGLRCPPFLAIRSLQQLVKDEGEKFPLAVPSLLKGRYMDDIFGGADTIYETKQIMNQLIHLCAAGGFPLQKWAANHKELLKDVSDSSQDPTISKEVDPPAIKILGLSWKTTSDTFHFTSHKSNFDKSTKRKVLSEIAQIFDPLGLLAPVTVKAKMFMQELWLSKIGWDDALPLDMYKRWCTFRLQLQDLQNLSIPRWIHYQKTAHSIEIHGFSDASQLAMAAVVYLRVVSENKEISVTLLCSKTKVAPLKKLTIPRLELSAALFLARLIKHVQRALDLSNISTYLWTDSTITLTWISSHPSRWKEYVRNRVINIQELSSTRSWRFISGKDNPADCASRGLQTDQLINHPIWWQGPLWLSKPSSSWPINNIDLSSDVNLEEKPSLLHTVSAPIKHSHWELLERYSNLKKLLRVTSTCRRVADKFLKKTNSTLTSSITPSELRQSTLFWVNIVQEIWFSAEIRLITKRISLSKSNALIRLTPYFDDQGLLRVGGRLQHSNLDEEAKHPLILPRNSPLSTLIIADAHEKTLHGGTQLTLAYIRQSYWILGGRAPVKSYILKCVRCARYRGARAQQLMGNLPSPRVTPSRAFLHTGVDYAGPVIIKTWRGRTSKTYKGYLAIFVCFATSAIHIELVTDYTTEAFIAAYKRFTGRRGICATLYSDCGTNFIGADKILRQRFDASSKEMKNLIKLLANDGTKWHFNPPSAPHFGGKWESAVKSVKFHLLRIIGDSILTYEELSTVLIQIEAVLNSRPLCSLSEDPDDFSALTPGHFLIGEAINTVPEPDLSLQPQTRLSRWEFLRQKLHQFWSRWSTECLQRLQSITKWHHPSFKIKEGSLVLITDERYPPAKWPLARVIQLHPGTDGLTRVVTVRTATGVFKRPIVKLALLPHNEETDSFGNLIPDGGRNVK